MSSIPARSADGIEILLVEDNPRDAELTMRALERHHMANHLVWAKDGAEALEVVFGPSSEAAASVRHAPNLILLDLKLPRVDGHELLQRLKADPRTRPIPVVVMTSSREEADLVRAYQSGANSFVVKPVDFDHFAEAMQLLGLYWLLLNQLPATVHSRAQDPP